MKNIYLTKDLARISGHSTHTIKYYMRIGLLKECGRSPETNFRYFDDSSLDSLKKIRTLQAQGHSLREIKNILDVGNGFIPFPTDTNELLHRP